MVPWDPPGVPRVPISGPVHGMFSKCNVLGPIGSTGYSHTTFSNGRFHERQSSFHIDVIDFFYNSILDVLGPKEVTSDETLTHWLGVSLM